jgi:hypothetical protein
VVPEAAEEPFVLEVPELTPEVPADLVGPGPGEPGWPCTGATDCASGFCITTPDGKQCTTTCEEECPFDWKCALYKPSLPDEIYVCAPVFMTLCRPCRSNAECMVNGVALGDACIGYGGAGSFCGAACGGEETCPSGYECAEVEDVSGASSMQCRRVEGECGCTQWFADEAASTDCYVENEWGVCAGERGCTAQGLSDCSAVAPEPEACNLEDDDCDGKVDEDTDGAACIVSNGFGMCPGTETCVNGKITCVGSEAKPEVCDGVDSDCDGQTDEGFPDTDEDGVADCIETDKDGDGIPDGKDNCVDTFNPGQADADLDTVGDVCDPDDDNDMVSDDVDCAPFDAAAYPGAAEVCDGKDNDCNSMVDEGFPDTDWDGWKDCVDDDDDGDGHGDAQDCAPLDAAVFPGAPETCDGADDDCDFSVDEGFPDVDADGSADCVDADVDGDGVPNASDNCPALANVDQADADKDGMGDLCDGDLDGDGVPNLVDNCADLKNPTQGDVDQDGLGDACDADLDGDGKDNASDNCPLVSNPGQEDADSDGTGDACENDKDGDGTPDAMDCAAMDPLVHPGADEVCNSVDDDCDLLVDEGFPDQDMDGLKDCVDNDDDGDGDPDQTDCKPLNAAVSHFAVETCNGVDDDCSGDVDDDLGTLSCGKGACAHTVAACIAGKVQTCDPFQGAAPEACDGKDNDCNGLTDEGLGTVTCGAGVCFHQQASCVNGKPANCNPMAGAGVEVCDGADNDCDGKVDEQLGLVTCGTGICKHSVAACVGGEEQACDPMQGALVETCDGQDNDCDGLTDEDLGETACGKGECFHAQPYCAAGKVLPCDPFLGAEAEVCDGKDNDCDSLSDEDLGTTTCGLGVCQHSVLSCVGGQAQPCDPMQGSVPEVCDGKDNDCDGATDEGLGKTTCGLGECEHEVDNCANGAAQLCDPMEGWQQETCDGLDNDCDSEADEGLGDLTCGLGKCQHSVASCVGGKSQSCDPMQGSVPELCNKLDDDCDGLVDEDFGFTVEQIGCKTVDVKNTGVSKLTGWTVKANGVALAVTEPSGGVAPGATGRIDLAYILDGATTVEVSAGCAAVTKQFNQECNVRMVMGEMGDEGGDYMAVERTALELAGAFAAATGIGVETWKDPGSQCGLNYVAHLLLADSEDLTKVDLIYYHNHGSFSFSDAAQKKLFDWVSKGGVLIFDDCGGADFVDLQAYFGFYITLNGNTSGGYQWLKNTDVTKVPFELTTGDLDAAATWTEGGQDGLNGGVEAIIMRGPTPWMSGKKVGNGWVAFVGGDWGCTLGSECDAGNTPSHKLMMNFAYIATGRAKLIK